MKAMIGMGPEHLLHSQDNLTVRDGPQDGVVQPLREGHRPLCVTGGTEVSALAGEREQVLVAAIVTADTGEALSQVAADKILTNDVGNNRAEVAVGVSVFLRVDPLELLIMLGDKAEECRFIISSG